MKRILIIGGGSIGERHVRCFQATQRADVSLCEINDDLRTVVGERYELKRSHRSIEEALADSAFDAAVICTPAHLHIPMAYQLAAHGCGLLIEKPLSISQDGTDGLIAEIADRQIPASVAYVLRQHPALQAMRACVAEGRFGRPVEVVYTGGQHFPFYRPAYREIYYARHEMGGGAIQDALTHVVNAAEWIVGPVTKLVADATHQLLEGVDVEDTVHLMTHHAASTEAFVMGSFSLNQHQAPNESTWTVICENGTVRFEFHHNRWLSCTQPGSDWVVEESFQIERDELFVRQANAFLDQLDEKTGPACSLAEAKQTLRVNLSALKSVQSGAWENV
jgi:predicted dehydrogenase